MEGVYSSRAVIIVGLRVNPLRRKSAELANSSNVTSQRLARAEGEARRLGKVGLTRL